MRCPPISTLFPYTTLFRSDFTGSAAVMEVLTFAGVEAVLFLDVPTADRLARFPAARAIGKRADRKSTRLNSSHVSISYAVFCLKKKKTLPTHNVQPAALNT